jgi:hypothetical protein
LSFSDINSKVYERKVDHENIHLLIILTTILWGASRHAFHILVKKAGLGGSADMALAGLVSC